MEWLQRLLDAAGRSQADLARHLGIAPPRVSEMVRGERRLQQREIRPTAAFFGLTVDDVSALLEGDAAAIHAALGQIGDGATAAGRATPPPTVPGGLEEPGRAAVSPVARVQAVPGRPDIPLWASAAAGDEGAIVLVPDPIDYLRRSERMLNVRNPFAFNVLGASMSPAIEHGDQVVVNPSVVARPGHDCVFIHEGPEGMLALVKRLLRANADTWRVRQFNEPRDFDISRKKWARVHPIAEIRKAGVG
jgi:phage repressor protein C with HTH and peptisase S24 domain